MCFLDTHIIIWLYQKSLSLLSGKAREGIENNEVYVSPVALLELQYLYEIKRIKVKPAKIIDYLKKKINLKIDDSGPLEIIESSLSLSWTRDPFDRIMAATTELNNAVLVTKDKVILKNFSKAVF